MQRNPCSQAEPLRGDTAVLAPATQIHIWNLISKWCLSVFMQLWCQLGLLTGTVPVPPVHHLSCPSFSLLWASLPALWLRMNFSQVWSTPLVSLTQPCTVPMETFTNRSKWLSESQTRKWRKSKGVWLTQEQILHSPHTAAFPAGMSRIGMNHKILIHCKISQLADTEGFAFTPVLC